MIKSGNSWRHSERKIILHYANPERLYKQAISMVVFVFCHWVRRGDADVFSLYTYAYTHAHKRKVLKHTKLFCTIIYVCYWLLLKSFCHLILFSSFSSSRDNADVSACIVFLFFLFSLDSFNFAFRANQLASLTFFLSFF